MSVDLAGVRAEVRRALDEVAVARHRVEQQLGRHGMAIEAIAGEALSSAFSRLVTIDMALHAELTALAAAEERATAKQGLVDDAGRASGLLLAAATVGSLTAMVAVLPSAAAVLAVLR